MRREQGHLYSGRGFAGVILSATSPRAATSHIVEMDKRNRVVSDHCKRKGQRPRRHDEPGALPICNASNANDSMQRTRPIRERQAKTIYASHKKQTHKLKPCKSDPPFPSNFVTGQCRVMRKAAAQNLSRDMCAEGICKVSVSNHSSASSSPRLSNPKQATQKRKNMAIYRSFFIPNVQ